MIRLERKLFQIFVSVDLQLDGFVPHATMADCAGYITNIIIVVAIIVPLVIIALVATLLVGVVDDIGACFVANSSTPFADFFVDCNRRRS